MVNNVKYGNVVMRYYSYNGHGNTVYSNYNNKGIYNNNIVNAKNIINGNMVYGHKGNIFENENITIQW